MSLLQTGKLAVVAVGIMLWLAGAAASNDADSSMKVMLSQVDPNECETFALNARMLIPDWYAAGQRDSIAAAIDFVDSACGEPQFGRLRELLAIDEGTYLDDLCDSPLLDEIFEGQGWFSRATFYYLLGERPVLVGGTRISRVMAYEEFVHGLASRLAETTDTALVAYMVSVYFSGDEETFYRRLHRNEFAGTCLQQRYDRAIADQLAKRRRLRGHWALHAGIWIPSGDNEILGNKIELGGTIGARFGRLGVDVDAGARFLNSKEDYVIPFEGELRSTDHYFGGHIAGLFMVEALRINRFGLDFGFGGGYDGFEAVYENEDDHESVGSWLLTVGVTPHVYLYRERNHYLGLHLRYNAVDYQTHGGSDLSGDGFSVLLTFGYNGRVDVTGRLRDLGHYDD